MPGLTGDFSQIYQAIRACLVGDATLAGMLGAPDQVFQDWPTIEPTWPALFIKLPQTNPSASLDGQGLWWPRLQIDLGGVDPVALRGIESRITNLLDTPRTNPAGFTTQDYAITELYLLDAQEAGAIRWQNSNQEVKLLATLWRMRVQHK